jgi:hypothetical protein
MKYKIIIILGFVLSPSLFAQKKFSPAKESLTLFNQYKPKIEHSNNAIVDSPEIFVGDINGDSLDDCLVYFVLTPKMVAMLLLAGKLLSI